MMVITSTLFLIAATFSIFAIFGSIGQSMPRILEVIENRDLTERRIRKITVGPVRMVSTNALTMPKPKLRQPSFAAKRFAVVGKVNLPSDALPLAA